MRKKWEGKAIVIVHTQEKKKFFFLKKKKFQKLKNPFLIDPEWSILAKGKVAISKTVATAAFGYIIIHNTNRI